MAMPILDLAVPPLAASALVRRVLLLAVAAMLLAALLSLAPRWLMPWGVPAALALALGAFFAEYVDSSLGMGYGTTLTPVLLIVGFSPLEIVPAVLLSELVTGLTAGLMHHRDGNVDWRRDRAARQSLAWLVSLTVLGALGAVWLAVSISKVWSTRIIAGIVISMALVILATRNRRLPYRPRALIGIGTLAAFNKGLSGGGYGPLVTAGQVVSGIDAKTAVAVTSVAEAFTCLVGLVGYLVAGKTLLLALALPLSLGALLSVPLATASVRRVSEPRMRAIVGVATLLLGLVALLRLAPA
ncbi:MAG: sulfite exporter TauE/SafE family protein [Myxococcota bacterium]